MILINGHPLTTIKFNGGEVQANINQVPLHLIVNKYVLVEAHVKNSDDIMLLLQAKTIIDKHEPQKVVLKLLRVPYAQSDRAMTQHECSGLKIFAHLLNSCNFDEVWADDPHSDVCEALINNFKFTYQHICLSSIQGFTPRVYDFLISPDGGALKKIYHASKFFELPVIEASKKRDVTTGQLSGTSVNANEEQLRGKSILIMDDIAEYATTHYNLAKVLKEEFKVARVDLYVTHGLFPMNTRMSPPSRFNFPLEVIDNIYTYNLWSSGAEEFPSNIFYKNLF